MLLENVNQNALIMMVIVLASAGAALLAYFIIGQDMAPVLWGVILIGVFLLCFFSVKMSLVILIFSMLLSPEVVVGSTVRRDITIRMEDLLLFVMTLGWLFRIAIIKDIGLMLKTPINRPIIAYSAVIMLSTIYNGLLGGISLLAGFFFALKIIEYFFVFYIVINYVDTKEEINRLLTMMLVVGFIICLYGLYQVVTGGVVAAPFEGGNAEYNTLGGYLVLMGSIAGGIFLHTDSRKEQFALAIMIVLLITLLMFSRSRGSWVACIPALLVMFLSSKRRRYYFIFIVLMIGLIPFFLPDVVRDRALYTITQHSMNERQISIFGLWLDTSTSARLISYKIALEYLYKHPVIGYGMTGFSFMDGQFFRTLVETGILGLATFIWMLSRVHTMVRQSIAHLPGGRLQGMAIGMLAGFWGMMGHALSANTFIIVRISEPFWCLVGLTVVCLYAHNEDVASIPEAEVKSLQKKLLMPAVVPRHVKGAASHASLSRPAIGP